MKKIIVAIFACLLACVFCMSVGARSALLELGTVEIVSENEVTAEQRYKEIVDAARSEMDDNYQPEAVEKEDKKEKVEEPKDTYVPEYSFEGLNPEITTLKSWFGLEF
jgi:hypothetical protein